MFEVCRQLKAKPKTAQIPIIFLSARDGVEDVVAGLKLGAVDYVSKPADPTILKARLSAHLTLAAAMADLKRQNALLAEHAHLREDVERMTRHDLKSPIAVAMHGAQSLLCYSMFNNALKNAAEASPDGATVTVELAPGYGAAHVVIENRGEVAPAMRGRFFDKYAPSDKVGGHGLGTYSIRLMAGVQGGDVAMNTADGITRLTFTLPSV